LTPRDFALAQITHLRSSLVTYGMAAIGTLNLLAAGWAMVQAPAAPAGYLLPGLAGLLFLFGMPAMAVLSAPAAFRRVPSLGDEMTLIVSDEGVQISSPAASGREPWSLYTSYLADGRHILLYHGPRTFRIIPRRAFASTSDADAFVTLVRERVGRVRRELLM
jgi:hypothetical protein